MRSQRVGLGLGSLLFAAILGTPSPINANDPVAKDGYVYQQGERPALEHSKVYELAGKRIKDSACYFEYPPLVVTRSGETLESRDIAIDQSACKKLVEEGVPTELAAADPDDARVSQVVGPSSSSSQSALTSNASGYSWAWWRDLVNLKVNQDKTNISWSYNGSCSLGGTTSGEWYWNYGSGWFIQSYSATESEFCSYYRGHTQSWFQNNTFCPFPWTKTFYDSVNAYGYPDGAFVGTRDSTTYNACLPLFLEYQVHKN